MAEQREADVAIVGAGPAGMAAAWAAAQSGQRVLLLDDNLTAGGQIWRASEDASIKAPARKWLRRLEGLPVERIQRASVVAAPAPRELLAETPGGPLRIAWKRLILCTGARELFLPFPGWTLPGIHGIGGLQALVKSGLSLKGRNVALAGSGPLLLAVAVQLRRAGARIVCIAEQAPPLRVFRFGVNLLSQPSKFVQAISLRLRLANLPYDTGWWPVRAEGDQNITTLTLTNGRRDDTIDCDMLGCAFGFVANLELPLLLGCQVARGAVVTDAFQRTSVENIYCAGEPASLSGVEGALATGLVAGHAATGNEQADGRHRRAVLRSRAFAGALAATFALRDEISESAADDVTVCRCEDVTVRRLREYADWRDAKLQTRVGMGPCQGRICGPACERLLGWKHSSVRPPVLAARVDTLIAGAKPDVT